MIKKLKYIMIFTLFIGCKTDDTTPDCSAVTCLAPHIFIELVDNDTNENIIIQNNITKESIIISDSLDELLEFSIMEPNACLLVSKNKLNDTFEIKINSELIANISYNTTNPKTNECCDFGELTNVIIANKTFTVEENKITIYL